MAQPTIADVIKPKPQKAPRLQDVAPRPPERDAFKGWERGTSLAKHRWETREQRQQEEEAAINDWWHDLTPPQKQALFKSKAQQPYPDEPESWWYDLSVHCRYFVSQSHVMDLEAARITNEAVARKRRAISDYLDKQIEAHYAEVKQRERNPMVRNAVPVPIQHAPPPPHITVIGYTGNTHAVLVILEIILALLLWGAK